MFNDVKYLETHLSRGKDLANLAFYDDKEGAMSCNLAHVKHLSNSACQNRSQSS